MATRKKPPESTQSSLFTFPKMTTPIVADESDFVMSVKPMIEAIHEELHAPLDNDGRVERKLRIVPAAPAQPSEDVIVEPHGDGRFVVSTLRHHGTTAAAVVYTRSQLVMLLKRIPAALEVG